MPHHDIGRGYSDKIVSEATYDEPKDDSVSENGAGNIQEQCYHVFPFELEKVYVTVTVSHASGDDFIDIGTNKRHQDSGNHP